MTCHKWQVIVLSLGYVVRRQEAFPSITHKNIYICLITLQVHEAIINVLNWIDPDLLQFIKDVDYVAETIAREQARLHS
jgi:hypothetical protein